MINLLPPKEKNIILMEERNKMIIIIWFLFFFFLMALLLILFSLESFMKGQVEYQKIALNGREILLEQSGIKEFQKDVTKSNKTIKELSGFYKNKIYFTEMIEKFFGILPERIYLNNFLIDVSDESFKFTVSGFSPTREMLFDFKKNLESADFNKVFFPQSNWIKAKNIDFNINFELPRNK